MKNRQSSVQAPLERALTINELRKDVTFLTQNIQIVEERCDFLKPNLVKFTLDESVGKIRGAKTKWDKVLSNIKDANEKELLEISENLILYCDANIVNHDNIIPNKIIIDSTKRRIENLISTITPVECSIGTLVTNEMQRKLSKPKSCVLS